MDQLKGQEPEIREKEQTEEGLPEGLPEELPEEADGDMVVFPDEDERGNKRGAVKWILCGAAVLLVLCIAGGSVFWYVASQKRAEQEKILQQQEAEQEAARQQAELEAAEKEKAEQEKLQAAETEEESGEFSGWLDYVYEIDDYSYPAYITVRDKKDKKVSVNINISDGLYDETYEGSVVSGNAVEFTLDPGEKIRLTWQDEETFQAAPEEGFTSESIQLVRMMCECLNDKTYHALEKAPEEEKKKKVEKKPEEIVLPPSGIYWEGDKPPAYAMYYVEIYNVTEDGFDFAAYGRYDEEDDFSLVFMPHTAVYEGENVAVYHGQQYTLTFCWEELGYLTVDGFPEWIPEGSGALYNNAYLGVS